MTSVRFYFDCISPYAWLAFTQLDRWENEHKTPIECIPVLFGALLDANGNLGPAEIPAKRQYVYTDAFRLASLYGLPVLGPPAHPFNPLKALRLVSAADDQPTKRRLGLALCHSAWRDGLDVTDDTVLHRILLQENVDATKYLGQIQTPAVKQRLIDQTADALRRGVFGVPTFEWKGELFWGVDRMDLLASAIHGEVKVDRKQLEIALGRPRGIDRKAAPNAK